MPEPVRLFRLVYLTWWATFGTAAKCHVWTAPCWQGFSERLCTAGRSCHVFGLLMRHYSMAAGHNALRGSGPGQKHALDGALALLGCPDPWADWRGCVSRSMPFPTW
jgi:hypothetical protein